MIDINKHSIRSRRGVRSVAPARCAAAGAALLALLAGCSLPQRLDGDTAMVAERVETPAPARFEVRPVGARGTVPVDARARDPEDGGSARGALHTELIETMLAQRQYYAALAHIEQRVNEAGATSELRYLEAEVRRHLGQSRAAEDLYRGLLRGESRYAGLAHHGLGLLAAERRDYRDAVQHLRDAARRRPTDGEIRNDLGYALMLAGRYEEALPELATAVELNAGDGRARNNLVMLMVLMKDEASVRRVAAESALGADELARLRVQAHSLAQRRTPEKGR